MIVVADTSPINYLAQIDRIDLLPQLYGTIIVPPAVMRELSHKASPLAVKKLLAQEPQWLQVRSLSSRPIATLASLDQGEREAIQCAEECRANLLLIDERKGWSLAEDRGLGTIGTLGVLLEAGERGWLDPQAEFLHLLSTTNFRASRRIRANFMQRTGLS